MTKPDFSDPGYGEISCLFQVVGILAGFVVAFVVAVTGLVADPNPSVKYDPLVWFVEVSVAAYTVGLLISLAVLWLVERVRALWGIGDALVFVGWLVVPAVVVVLLILTPSGAALVVPLALGSLVLYAVVAAWAVLMAFEGRRKRS